MQTLLTHRKDTGRLTPQVYTVLFILSCQATSMKPLTESNMRLLLKVQSGKLQLPRDLIETFNTKRNQVYFLEAKLKV